MSKILLVDDDANVLRAFEEVLVGQGHTVVTARRGEEGLEQIDKERPDVVVMDICLPGIDGLEALRRIKQKYATLPVLVLTGHSTQTTATEARMLGAFDYQLKPPDPTKLLETIARALESVDSA